ncbi:MAG: energy transducer TonB [Bacteroidota bacterium]
MEPKKSPKADLESKKGLFIEIGFIVAFGLVLLAFEWTSQPKRAEGFQQQSEEDIVQEDIPITRQQKEKEPPPPPPSSTEQLNIVDDDVEIEDELRLEQTEADEDTEVSIDAFASQEDEEEEEENQIFVVVEDMPEFKGGGINAFRKYVQENIKYPTVAAENGIEGTVFVQFVVDTDGGISNVTVTRGVDPSLNEEAIRVIRNAPEWEPGQQRGNPVRVQFTIPIVFRLQ